MSSTLAGPDFESVVQDFVELPYRKEKYLRLSFSDPLLEHYEVIMILDSYPAPLDGYDDEYDLVDIFNSGRLVTIVGRFPRPFLAEANTHRVFGRNSASSRARSVKATITDVMLRPFIPLFTVNQKGMSGAFASPELQAEATEGYLAARDSAVGHALLLLLGKKFTPADVTTPLEAVARWEELLDIYYRDVYSPEGEAQEGVTSIHKQNVNRILEPYMWHEVIITSSEWFNFIDLRDHDAAQPEIRAFARLVRAALEISLPKPAPLHLPFVDVEIDTLNASFEELRPLLMLSATECAQISYRDKSSAKATTATTSLGERLLAMGHLSPFEHIAFSEDSYFLLEEDNLPPVSKTRSNLSSDWVQLRKILTELGA